MQDLQVQDDSTAYLIGGGIASLAAAAFLIRDANFKGHNIVVLEESAQLGGSLDAAGTSEHGYVMRGGRMIESKYLCTFDCFLRFQHWTRHRRSRKRSSSGTRR